MQNTVVSGFTNGIGIDLTSNEYSAIYDSTIINNKTGYFQNDLNNTPVIEGVAFDNATDVNGGSVSKIISGFSYDAVSSTGGATSGLTAGQHSITITAADFSGNGPFSSWVIPGPAAETIRSEPMLFVFRQPPRPRIPRRTLRLIP